MSVDARGFSLPETLIAMAIGSVLLLGTARFLPALQRQVLKQTQQHSLDNELWQRRLRHCPLGQRERRRLEYLAGGDVRCHGVSVTQWRARNAARRDPLR
ncbi:hypothetical protein D3C80_27620 [compost metagenome]